MKSEHLKSEKEQKKTANSSTIPADTSKNIPEDNDNFNNSGKQISNQKSTNGNENETINPLEEMKELLQRTQANFENYRKQNEKRIESITLMAAKDIILQLLPIMDNFELALKNAGSIKNEFVHGIELIFAQLFEILANNGVKTIEVKGQKFDPYYHEALMKVNSNLPENTIIDELQKGFTFHEQVIRPAKVVISSGKEQNCGTESKNEIKQK